MPVILAITQRVQQFLTHTLPPVYRIPDDARHCSFSSAFKTLHMTILNVLASQRPSPPLNKYLVTEML